MKTIPLSSTHRLDIRADGWVRVIARDHLQHVDVIWFDPQTFDALVRAVEEARNADVG